jgi:predicted TIM-barrel fold metal-dependent hydrolase
MFPTITIEEHFMSRCAFGLSQKALNAFTLRNVQNLLDTDRERIDDMDKDNISLQVFSHIPTVQPLEICQKVNDEMFQVIQATNKRFAVFAMLPMNDPRNAVTELTRCVKELRFVGALVVNHCEGRFCDDEFY